MSEPWGLYEPSTEHDACGVGFIAHVRGEKSRAIVDDALEILRRLAHRGATGADEDTGDGAGILLQLPHRFFKAEGLRLGFDMPNRRRYGVGQIFLPPEPDARAACEKIFNEVVAAEGQHVLGWRDVPTVTEQAGVGARRVLPVFRQIFVRLRRVPPSAFERTLFVIRKLVENRIRQAGCDPRGFFHVASFSTETIVYKGLLLPRQLEAFYPDLSAPDFVSGLAVIHSRFSTNTMPTWDLAQPFRCIAHNGEINTLRGNAGWMEARRSQLQSAKFRGGLDRLHPIVVPGKSDSAQFDNMLELLHLGGRSVPHAIMMMIPEAWEGDDAMDKARRDFYRYSTNLVEPWDGPAAIVFTDGLLVGATLDRNGLRPARWLQTDDDRVILASEAGILDIPAERIIRKGRLQPGRMFIVDTTRGRIVQDDEVKSEVAGRFPYGQWLEQNLYEMSDARGDVELPTPYGGAALTQALRAFGYTDEDLDVILAPMAASGKEPVGSMGTDTPLAVLSDQAPTLFHYFHQLFAQVTNPPIDPIREALVMTLETHLGPDGNTFEETPEQCHQIRLASPFLSNAQLAQIRGFGESVFESTTLSALWPIAEGAEGLAAGVAQLCAAATHAIDDGVNILIISDRGVDAKHAPIPALLALSAVQQHLVREGIRMQASLIIETGEAREVHDFACLIGHGAAAVNPYLALDVVAARASDPALAQGNFLAALDEGLRKVMSKMGISTIQSYRGAQIFEAVGLDRELVNAHFRGTPSRLGGIGLPELGREALERHARGFGDAQQWHYDGELPVGGFYAWRRQGERHKWGPATLAALRAAVAEVSDEHSDGDRARFAEYEAYCDDEDSQLATLRGLLAFSPSSKAIAIDEVEPVSSIVKRFVTGAMSFGSISAEAHETLAIAMNRLGARSNSGEGGEEAHRFVPDANGDSRRSAIKQVASGRFGVTAHYLVISDELQIKVAQGAKPGEGGQLPGPKVDARIAAVRCSTPGVSLISPPPHHDIYSIEDLAQLIFDLTAVHPTARVSVKLVSEVGVGTVAAGVAKARAGGIVIAGYEGGTGASPLSSLRHAGLPWELGLAEAQQLLVANRLRDRVRLQVDGGLRTGRDVVIAAMLGAEEFGLATASLVATGCVMLRKCHLNTCSVGIATQDEALRARYRGKPEQVVAFFTMIAESVRRHLAALGVRSLDDIVGNVERLTTRSHPHWKGKRLDLSAILAVPPGSAATPRRFAHAMPWPLHDHFDHSIVEQLSDSGHPNIEIRKHITTRDRAVGTLLSGELARRHGATGYRPGRIMVRCEGAAGQSFGAFLVDGVTLALVGEANDGVGKGLSGGRITVAPSPASPYIAADNVIIGNTALYGATAGELFVCGRAGERFAVRNSGADAVVEGLGDHGCEYMTGGIVVVLGETGRNFAAGMSGGIAYVYDPEDKLRARCNLDGLELTAMPDADEARVHRMIAHHVIETDSVRGAALLADWRTTVASFMRVMPTEYRRALAAHGKLPMHRDAGVAAHG